MAAEPGDLLTSAGGAVLAQLGERLRARRRELGRTLASVSAEAEVSVSYLSELEAGNNTPSLPLLARLAHALGLPLNELLRQTSSSPIATGMLDTERPGVARTSAAELRLAVVSLVAEPGQAGAAPLSLAGSDLFVHVREGELDVAIGDATLRLGEGDSLQATRPRAVTWSAPGDGRSVSLWVTSRPEAVSP